MTILHSGTTISDGGAININASSVTLQAYLGPDGGSATCNVYGRIGPAAPWELLWTAGLSGASDSVPYILEERWPQLKGSISAISSATATIVLGG